MKKLLSLLLIFVLIISLVSCSKPKPMTKDTYQLIKQAISLMEDYHSGKIAGDDVKGPLKSIKTQLDSIAKRDKGKHTGGSEYANQNDFYASTAAMYVDQFVDHMDSVLFENDTYTPFENLKGLLE